MAENKLQIWKNYLVDTQRMIKNNPQSKFCEGWIRKAMKLEGLIKGFEEAERVYKKEIKQLEKQWKETCEIMSNKKTMEGIKISLKQIVEGKTIPLSELNLKERD